MITQAQLDAGRWTREPEFPLGTMRMTEHGPEIYVRLVDREKIASREAMLTEEEIECKAEGRA